MTKSITMTELVKILSLLNSDLCFCLISATNPKGYPTVLVWGKNRTRLAHNVVFEVSTGTTLDGTKDVHHSCKVRRCINPKHLEALTRQEHAAVHAGSFCKYGHARTPENTYFTKEGWRQCIQCRKDAEARRQVRKVLNLL